MARPPKSRQLHLLEKEKLYGDVKNRIAKEPRQKNENLKPICPKDFNEEERKIWKNCANILDQYGLLNLANGIILNLLVKNISSYNECVADINNRGVCIAGMHGEIPNPFWQARNKCEDNIMKYLNLLGLSSMGLAKLGCLQVRSEKKKTEMEKLIE